MWDIKSKSKSRKFEERHNCQRCTELTDEACSSTHEKETSSSGSGLNSSSYLDHILSGLMQSHCTADGPECQACCKCAVCSHIFLKRTATFWLGAWCTCSVVFGPSKHSAGLLWYRVRVRLACVQQLKGKWSEGKTGQAVGFNEQFIQKHSQSTPLRTCSIINWLLSSYLPDFIENVARLGPDTCVSELMN